MNDVFETFKVQFHNRNSFNRATAILATTDFDKVFHDIGHSDMIISFDDKSALDNFVSELKGTEDFTID